MNVSVVMPQLGLTMMEGTVSGWFKKPGDKVQKNEPIFVVSTDKADTEVESIVDGTLVEILVPNGQTVPVGTVLAYIAQPGVRRREGDEGSAPEASQQVTSQASDLEEAADQEMVPTGNLVSNEPKPTNRRRPASPRARRLARELGVDVSTVHGTGPAGRVLETDVRKHKKGPSSPPAAHDLNRRRVIAEKMTESIQSIPHFSVASEVNALQLIALYESLKEPVAKARGLKLSLTDLLLKALAVALRQVPEANAIWANGRVQDRTTVDLALAVATERGVVAPVLRNVDRIDLVEMLVARNDLMQRARGGRLSIADLEGAGGTLSNLGMYRVDAFQAIITPGQSFVLAVGRIRNRPWPEATLTIRPTAILNLSMDHRVVDGIVAARLLEKVLETIESPFQILWRPSSLVGK